MASPDPNPTKERPSFTQFLKKTKQKGVACEGPECVVATTPQRRGRKSNVRASESSECKYLSRFVLSFCLAL